MEDSGIGLEKRNPKPYGSYGNGSAMRVSVAGCGARIVFGEKGE